MHPVVHGALLPSYKIIYFTTHFHILKFSYYLPCNFSVVLHPPNSLPPYTLSHSHIFPQSPHDPDSHLRSSQRKLSFPATVGNYSPAISRSSETTSYQQNIRKTLETFHFQSTHTGPRTRTQSRRTTLPCCQIHTTTRTSVRPHCQAVSLPPTPSGCFQIIRQTNSHRNNTVAHEGHIPDLHIPTSHGQPPVPGKSGVHSPHCILHNSGLPILCILKSR